MCKKVPKCNEKDSQHFGRVKIDIQFIDTNPNNSIINKK
jgi:hypothetical protein